MPQPAAKLVLDKLTFLCIGCKIGNQEEEKPWNHYDLPLPEEREALLTLLEQAPIATVCAQFASSEELLEAFRPGGFDLLLMDIYMDGMTGVEAVREIREMDESIPIAFATTSTEHTLESYRLSVLKYLEKPVRQKDINDLLHLVKLQRDSAPRLAIRQGGETQKIPLSELFYLEQKAHHVFLYRRDGGTALFLPPQKLLRQSGLCPGDQRGIPEL